MHRVNYKNIPISEIYPEIAFKMFVGYFDPEIIDGDLRFYFT